MKFHIITNIGSLLESPFVKEFPNTLCLAQLCDVSLPYTRALKEKIKAGHRVILDNGAHEGIDIDLTKYAHITMDLQPTVVVLTDLVGRSFLDSRWRSLKLIELIQQTYGMEALPKTKFMYVPQGKDKGEVLEDYRWAIANLDPSKFIIGFGQGYLCWAKNELEVNMEATRMPMVDAVMRMSGSQHHEYHVLGARWSADGSDYSWWPCISGIDTIKPTTCAANGVVYPHRPSVRSIDRESLEVIDEAKLRQNIESFCQEYGAEG